jgi:uncharacterized protein
MDASLILNNILNPPVLFFFLGMFAVLVKSDLEVPPPLPKLFSLYLLLAIGLKGGYELQHNSLTPQIGLTLLAAIIMSAVVPLYSFWILRRKLSGADAAAIAATYGSISAVTFITAGSFLDQLNIDHGGHMVAALALMESPAIIVGLVLARTFGQMPDKVLGSNSVATTLVTTSLATTSLATTNLVAASPIAASPIAASPIAIGSNMTPPPASLTALSPLTVEPPQSPQSPPTDQTDEADTDWGEIFREACLNGSVLMLIGSLTIGVVTGDKGWHKMAPLTENIFYGVLAFFLLDMGLVAARRLQDLKRTGVFLVTFAIAMPVINAAIGILIAKLIGLAIGDSLLFAVLCASASYIAVPAAMRMTVPNANPSLYVAMALALTFPFNIILGIPLYMQMIQWL